MRGAILADIAVKPTFSYKYPVSIDLDARRRIEVSEVLKADLARANKSFLIVLHHPEIEALNARADRHQSKRDAMKSISAFMSQCRVNGD
jgi:hypothetical protein